MRVYNGIILYIPIFSMQKNDIIFSALRIPVDFILLLCAGACAYLLRVSDLVSGGYPVLFNISFLDFMGITVVVALILIALMLVVGLYNVSSRTKMVHEALWVAGAISAGIALIIVVLFFQLVWFDSRFIIVAGWMFAVVFVVLGRIGLQVLHLYSMKRYGIGRRNVLIIGDKHPSSNIRRALLLKYGNGVSIVGELPTIEFNLLRTLHKARNIHHIIMASPQQRREDMVQLISFCENNFIQFSYAPDLFDSLLADMDFDVVGGIAIVSVHSSSLQGWQLVVKRSFDVVGSVALLVLLCVPFLFIAFLVKWESKGPVFLKTARVGQSKPFLLYKFRSMINNAHLLKKHLVQYNERDDGPFFKMTNDPRVTKIGSVLRKTRIDELPQLFNVLKGEMSLVGPRPHEQQEIAHYRARHKKVFFVKPGVTGFSQVSGAQNLSFEEEIRLDRYYIEHWSFKLDMVILFKTLLILLFRHDGV